MPERWATSAGLLQDLLGALADQGRKLLDRPSPEGPAPDMISLSEALLSSRGEATGTALADAILTAYRDAGQPGRLAYFRLLQARFGIDAEAAAAAAERYRAEPVPENLQRLRLAAEPRRQELFRRLNHAPGGTAALVRMRSDLLALLADEPALRDVDADLVHLFQSWFNRGFLELRRINWSTPAAILEKIIAYEAVHEIAGWDDLRRRIDPRDRRLYAFFHPRLPLEPLIFVEVALMVEVPAAIADILAADRPVVEPDQAKTAVFYSISNCQTGLRGISFGSFLIKQVLEDLSAELRGLKTFVTLSPVPGFARWVDAGRRAGRFGPAVADELACLDRPDWPDDMAAEPGRQALLMRLAADYLMSAGETGAPLDPVARFHLGNGARLERINWPGDLSPAGLAGGLGVMVNYLYRPREIEANHEAFANHGRVAVSAGVRRLLEPRHMAVAV
jgi:malonyl-CoA decarboxylase